jgi:uncharacterized protein YbcI
MTEYGTPLADQIARAANAFAQQTTGHAPRSVTVVLNGDTLVVTLHGALSPAEKALASSPAGAARLQEFHRQLFSNSSNPLRQEIERLTGVAVREASAEVEPDTGIVVKVFSSGTVVQVFQLTRSIPADVWGAGRPADPS